MPGSRIEEFYDSDVFLLIGMSKKKSNFAWGIYKSLINSNRKVLALHPGGGEKNGVKFYKNIESLPEKPDACIVCTDLKKNDDLISELSESGIKRIWLQQGSYDKTVLEKTAQNGMEPITGCVLMYLPESSFLHRVHRFFYELFTKGQN